jgi:DNA-3-methyladenine glycosylase II
MSIIVNEYDIKQILEKDEIFANIFSIYGPPPQWKRPQGFVTLSRIILEQQVSLESAKAHFIKLSSYISDFTPENILKLTDEEMRFCQISRQKANYLHDLSEKILDEKIDLESFSKLSLVEIKYQLKTVKGIGDWTADIYLIFCLQAKDIFPTGDVAVINAIKKLSNIKIKNGIHKLTESWSPYRSLAAFFLWHYYLKKRNREVIY